MTRKRMIFLIIVLAMVSLSVYIYLLNASPTEAFSNRPAGTAVLKDIPLVLNKDDLGFAVLDYNNEIYVALPDICRAFSLQSRQKGKIINIVSDKAKENVARKSDISWQDSQTVDVYTSDLTINFEGTHSYLEPIIFDDCIYVSLVHFSEECNRNVEYDQSSELIKIVDIPEKNIGIVNGDYITEQEFNYFFIPQKRMLDNIKYSHDNNLKIDLDIKRKEALDTLIERKIINQKIIEYKIKFDGNDEKAFNTRLDDMVDLNNGIRAIRKLASEYDSTFVWMVHILKEDYLRDKLKNTLLADIKATGKEIAEYYQEHEAAMYQPPRVKIRQIMLLNSYNEDGSVDYQAREEKRNISDGIHKQIVDEGNFEKLMKEYTEDPDFEKNPDGYILELSERMDEVGKTAFSMNVGQVSGVVETPYGFHIIRLEEIIPEKMLSLIETKAYIVRQLEGAEKQKKWDELLEKWKRESNIEIY